MIITGIKLTIDEVVCIVAFIILLPVFISKITWEIKFFIKEVKKPKRKSIQELIEEQFKNDNL